MKIAQVQSEADLAPVRALFQEYALSLGFELSFQNFQSKLANLPGDYALPGGALLLASDGSQVAGCVALRKSAEGICEMKRLYVRPNFRGQGKGPGLGDY